MKTPEQTPAQFDRAIIAELAQTETRRLEQNERLISVLQVVEKEIKRQNSLKLSLLRGALYGLGTVIGATVLIAILGWFITQTVGTLDAIPLFGDLINNDVIYESGGSHR